MLRREEFQLSDFEIKKSESLNLKPSRKCLTYWLTMKPKAQTEMLKR